MKKDIPNRRQVNVIGDLLNELPEEGPNWIGGKSYTIAKLGTEHPKYLLTEEDESGNLHAQIKMPMTTTPPVLIPEKNRHLF